MSYLAPVRAHLAALVAALDGGARFVACDASATVLTQPVDALERRFDLVITPGRPLAPMNALDGSVERHHVLTVRIAYPLTNAGGDLAEGYTEQHGPGTREAVEDRAALDDHDVSEALDAVQTAPGEFDGPQIVDVLRTDEAASTEERDDRVVLSIPFTLKLLVAKPGFYAP